MMQITIDDLSKNTRGLLTKIEKGESCIVTREGRPIAEILPVGTVKTGWKREGRKIKLPEGILAQSYVEEERRIK